jgi:NifU-like protein involved in Fe-S cluster formation
MSDSPAVLQRVRDPKHVGWMNRDRADVGTGEAGSLDEATWTRIQVRIDAASGRIEDAVFKVVGCSAAIASASLVTERLHGAHITDAGALEGLMVVAELQLPVERAHVAALAIEAAGRAIADWEKKQPARRAAGAETR